MTMKRLLTLLAFCLLPFAKAQTLEFSVSLPLSAQVALNNVPISDALSFGLAASLERLRLSADARLDIAPIGSAQASLRLEWAYVGRFRTQIQTRATLGSASLSLGAAFWSAAPANFDQFEVFATDPLPNSTGGSRFDLGLTMRLSRNWALTGQLKFGSDASSNTVQVSYRSSGFDFQTGIFSSSQLGGSAYLWQFGITLPFDEDATAVLSVGGGLGVLNSNFTFEANLNFSLLIAEGFDLELGVMYQPYRFEVLPLRGMLELKIQPGFGTLLLTGFAGLNQVSTFNGGFRLTYRIAFEELFPS